MALLQNHLEQINLTAQSIGELEFPRATPFTNALLHNQEITALIRDTEPHERGLFTVDPSIRHNNGQARVGGGFGSDSSARRRTTQFTGQPQSSAVARVLGSDMLRKIQSSSRDSSRGRSMDIEVLLQGVEKLCGAYDVEGTKDKVDAVRSRHQQIAASIKYYEAKISKQQSSLSRFDQIGLDGGHQDVNVTDGASNNHDPTQKVIDDDLRAEEEMIEELEARKKALESRVAEMERDLGGLRG